MTLYRGYDAGQQEKVSSQPVTGVVDHVSGGRVGLMVRSDIAEFQELEQWNVGHGSGTPLASPRPP